MKRYVLVGCGNRGIFSCAVPLVKKYGDCAQLCGVFDVNGLHPRPRDQGLPPRRGDVRHPGAPDDGGQAEPAEYFRK